MKKEESSSTSQQVKKLNIQKTNKFRDNERLFHYLDEDGDGKISPAELRNCVRSVTGELLPEELKAVVELLDSDGDGLLGLEDFVGLMEGGLMEGDREEEEKVKELKEAFGFYEMDGCGCITPKSLKRTLSKLGEKKTVEECVAMISQFDLNGDGMLSFEEFMAMMI